MPKDDDPVHHEVLDLEPRHEPVLLAALRADERRHAKRAQGLDDPAEAATNRERVAELREEGPDRVEHDPLRTDVRDGGPHLFDERVEVEALVAARRLR